MVQLIIFSSTHSEEFFKHCYKLSLTRIGNIPEGIFDSVRENPSPRELLKILVEESQLILMVVTKSKTGYIGWNSHIFLQGPSMKVPVEFTWEEFLECAKRTPTAPIRFSM